MYVDLNLIMLFQTRVLKSDFARYNVDDEDGEDLDSDENGWKIIHTDVFRFPPQKNLFCAILGKYCLFIGTVVICVRILCILVKGN
jgi:transmembrane 9 superfamily protein 1